MTEPLIVVENLVTHYGDRKILDGVSLEVYEGEILVIIGGSGCGKTTLLKHMTGLLKPTSGSIRYRGTDITLLDEDKLAELQQTIGIAFQGGALFNSMTIADNVALPLREYGHMEERLIDAVVRLKLSLVGLAESRALLPEELSGGMRKRAGLARALALDPPVVYFDEPSAGLDPVTAAGLDQLILSLNRMLRITFIIVTHELESIRTIAHRAVMLHGGKAIFTGTVPEAEASENPHVQAFFKRRADGSFAKSGKKET